MIGVAAIWIAALLLIGGFALDRVLSRSIVDSFDNQLVFVLNSMIASSEIGPDGEVRFNRAPADQRFVEPYSGLYFQISGTGAETFPSRSLWDRRLRVADTHADVKPHLYDSDEFSTTDHAEPMRVVGARRDPAWIDGALALPGRAIARNDRRPDPQSSVDFDLELLGAWRRACSSWLRCRPSMACGRSAGSAMRSPPSGRARKPASATNSRPRSRR